MILWLLLLGFFACIGFMIRNHMVLRERQRVLARISELCMKDIEANNFAWSWRYVEFNSISYEQMLWSFRPLKSFYRDNIALRDDEDR